ncbi:hypothetical protein PNK_0682 [Candidatus Protochlamydia naegleriophila]|uniref:Uncharacterized protein n=1 Tax=Candidatus Protochlamydia naegleriophila TaxID=389348 RepID=A0A0U5JBZ0_9BACT|nr:hypothetical protein [Candidatus Protochlamydia naegleriophila]CUI16308.1 hypothetical protein PNK_0682 [Candidatus Protochlamydia naegleriophila]
MTPLGNTSYINTNSLVLAEIVPATRSSSWRVARLFTCFYAQVLLGFKNLGSLIGRVHSVATNLFSCTQKDVERTIPSLQPLSQNIGQVELRQERISQKSSQNLSEVLIDKEGLIAGEEDIEHPETKVADTALKTEIVQQECLGSPALPECQQDLERVEDEGNETSFHIPINLSIDILPSEPSQKSLEPPVNEGIGSFNNLLGSKSLEPPLDEGDFNSLNDNEVKLKKSEPSLSWESSLAEGIGSFNNLLGSKSLKPIDEDALGEGAFNSLNDNEVKLKKPESSLSWEPSLAERIDSFKNIQFPKGKLDTLTLSSQDRRKWRRARFEARQKLPLLTQVERDIVEERYCERLPTIKNSIYQEIENFAIDLSEEMKDAIVDKVAQHYLLTMQYYSPAITLWIHSLLLHARESNKKLVFLARDGIVFYDVAKILLEKNHEKYGDYPDDHLIVAWLSRKSSMNLEGRGDLAQRYFKQLGIEAHEPIILVDTGVTGSIKRNISALVNNDLEAQFSISRNPAIYGFWDNSDFTIQAIALIILPPTHQDAWVNDPQVGNRWLEDTHRGNFIGAERFEDDCENGVIYPVPSMEMRNNTLVLNQVSVNSENDLCDFLVREFGRRAVTDFALSNVDEETLDYNEIKRNLNDLLTRIQKAEAFITTCTHD